MKIGILTYHRAHNYGAIMQAIATRCVCNQLHHDAFYIDYWPDYHKAGYQLFSTYIFKLQPSIKSKLLYCIEQLINLRKNYKRQQLFKHTIDHYISPNCLDYHSGEQFDAVIYGSDQVWRKQSTGRFNPIYFADNPIFAKKHIAYAASMGKLHSEDGDLQFLHDKLQKFDAISVREASLCQLVNRAGFASKVVLDPTLLLTKEDWNNTIPTRRLVKEDYLLFYNMQKNAFNYDAVERFANSKGLKVVEIRPDSSHKKNVFSLIGPEEFLSLVRYSSFVITSSFHGLAFSVIYEKQFFCSYSEKADRAKTLLSSLQLGNRLIMPGLDKLPTCENIDYKHSKLLFEHMKEESINFLLEAFQN